MRLPLGNGDDRTLLSSQQRERERENNSFKYFTCKQILLVLLVTNELASCFPQAGNDLEYIDDIEGENSTGNGGETITNQPNANENGIYSPKLSKNSVDKPEPIGDEISTFPEKLYERSRRAIAFRPLFVYRQQLISRRRIEANHNRKHLQSHKSKQQKTADEINPIRRSQSPNQVPAFPQQ